MKPSHYLLNLTLPLILSIMLAGVARADLSIIVHPDNPVSTLSTDEVRQIFLGRMRLYPNTQKNIDPVDQHTARPTFEKFYRVVANLTPTTLQRLRAMYLFSGKGMLPKMLPGEGEVVEFVAKHPQAIGYINSEHADQRVKTVLLIKD